MCGAFVIGDRSVDDGDGERKECSDVALML